MTGSSFTNLPRVIEDGDNSLYDYPTPANVVGQGSFGSVFLVRRKVDSKVVACKMQKHKPAKGRSASNLPGVREIKIWKRACNSGISKHVVRLLDAAVHPAEGLTYCYMEYHQGGTLSSLSKAIHKTEAAIMHPVLLYHLASEIALGLMELHSRKILHLDLKSNNIVLTQPTLAAVNTTLMNMDIHPNFAANNPGLVTSALQILNTRPLAVLIDFTLSRDISKEPADPSDPTDPHAKTMAADGGRLYWSKSYQAPELVLMDKQTERADIYSFGVLLYQLCTRETPEYWGDMERLPEVYERLQDVVDGCTELMPWQRARLVTVTGRLLRLRQEEMERVLTMVRKVSVRRSGMETEESGESDWEDEEDVEDEKEDDRQDNGEDCGKDSGKFFGDGDAGERQ
ncbi:hypothetical protein VTJ04DRAFT_9734 [Mycothermus thermophilus]|uniref:uncharacterized protein n=1 Tax=Humicola insolens TaxID=85995 RepID=UPI003743D231